MTAEDSDQTLVAQTPVAAAAAQFIHALRGVDAIARTTRVEATLTAVGADGLFAAERTLAGLWPDDAGTAPAHEVIWLRPSGEGPLMKLAAFDAGGQVLLRQSYSVPAYPVLAYPAPAQKPEAPGHG